MSAEDQALRPFFKKKKSRKKYIIKQPTRSASGHTCHPKPSFLMAAGFWSAQYLHFQLLPFQPHPQTRWLPPRIKKEQHPALNQEIPSNLWVLSWVITSPPEWHAFTYRKVPYIYKIKHSKKTKIPWSLLPWSSLRSSISLPQESQINLGSFKVHSNCFSDSKIEKMGENCTAYG